MALVLAGDIGGTKVNLALCEVDGSKVSSKFLRRYVSAEYKSLSEVIHRYFVDILAESKISVREVRSACFGVPGPVFGGVCQTVNLPWVIKCADIEAAIGIRPVRLVNDLEAMAYGIQTLEQGRGLAVLRASNNPTAERNRANRGLIAPGTGLGEALMIWDGKRHVVSASEGGHSDFGPQNEEQIELLRWLWGRHKHVSFEHVASGPAIHRLYRFLKETGREKEPPELAQELDAPGVDASPIIAGRALAGECSICCHALDLWLFCLGAEVGNLAMKALTHGGLYIGGGVVPNILELFRRPSFFEGLESKGRMSEMIKGMPIFAVTDTLAGLYGAAFATNFAEM